MYSYCLILSLVCKLLVFLMFFSLLYLSLVCSFLLLYLLYYYISLSLYLFSLIEVGSSGCLYNHASELGFPTRILMRASLMAQRCHRLPREIYLIDDASQANCLADWWALSHCLTRNVYRLRYICYLLWDRDESLYRVGWDANSLTRRFLRL